MNRKKITVIVLCTVLVLGIFTSCAEKEKTTPGTTTQQVTTPGAATPQATTPAVDGVTTASIVNTPEAFLKAASKEGTWIIAVLKDMTIDKDIVLEGGFKNKDVPARKIALYTQDDKRNVTARFTLKAPKLIVRSENASIQHGTFVGDVYVENKDFNLVDAKVEGSIHFASDEYKATFKKDDKSVVTGVVDIKK
jgi:hypothetical protein